MDLEVEFTANYPNELPKLTLYVKSGMLSELDTLHKHIIKEAERSLGMAMVFTLVSCIEEWLTSHGPNSKATQVIVDEFRTLNTRPQSLEQPLITMRGGPVTKESFSVWHKKFLAETESSVKQSATKTDGSLATKLTGKELFEQYQALSSLKTGPEKDMILDGNAFEGLDDLDLEEEEVLEY